MKGEITNNEGWNAMPIHEEKQLHLSGLDNEVYTQTGFKRNTHAVEPQTVSEICLRIYDVRYDAYRGIIECYGGQAQKRPTFLDKLAALIPFGEQNNASEPAMPSEAEVLDSLHRLMKDKYVHLCPDGRWVRSYEVLPKDYTMSKL